MNPFTTIALAIGLLIAPAITAQQIDETVLSSLGSIDESALTKAIKTLADNDTVFNSRLNNIETRVKNLESKKNLAASATGTLGTDAAAVNTSPIVVRAFGNVGSGSLGDGPPGGNSLGSYPSTASSAVVYQPYQTFQYQHRRSFAPLPRPTFAAPSVLDNMPAATVEITGVYDTIQQPPQRITAPRAILRRPGCYRDRNGNIVCSNR